MRWVLVVVGAATAPAHQVDVTAVAVAAGDAVGHPAAGRIEGREDAAGLGAEAAVLAAVARAGGAGERALGVESGQSTTARQRSGGGAGERAERDRCAPAEEAAPGSPAG